MVSNYKEIRDENRRRYGTDIGRIGPILLADRYEGRSHFICQLLQNAEEALRRRGDWHRPRKVSFEPTPAQLSVPHFGTPFDDADLRGVCGMAETTKDKHTIGRFGIGFTFVYTLTDRPVIHSDHEALAIEDYVQPTKVAALLATRRHSSSIMHGERSMLVSDHINHLSD